MVTKLLLKNATCSAVLLFSSTSHTDKKENKIFLIYEKIPSGAVAKSYMRKGFLIYEEMRKYFPIYEEAVSHI
jgi:hypothetical protein